MRKVLFLPFVLLLLFSLCACGNEEAQNTTPTPTTGITESTQAPTTATTTPTTTPATAAPTVCSHRWQDATCTTPKTCAICAETDGNPIGHNWDYATCTAPQTCTVCGATEGTANGHNYNKGVCTVCNAVDTNTPFTGNTWTAYIVRPSDYGEAAMGEVLSVYSLMATQLKGYAHKDYYSNAKYEGDPFDSITYNGKTYYDFWFSSEMNGISWDDQGDTVTVAFPYLDPVLKFVLTRTGETQFTVTTSNDTAKIPVGTIFTND